MRVLTKIQMSSPRKLIIDIETDAIDANVIWCVVCKEHNTPDAEYKVFTDKQSFKNYLLKDDILIAHNGIGFDFLVLNKLWGVKIDYTTVVDTLILSRLFNPDREGGHSLAKWGETLGYNKLDFSDFNKYSEQMLVYCKRDVDITDKLYKHLRIAGDKFSKQSIVLEHRIAHIIQKQKIHGFYLDRDKAVSLFTHTKQKAQMIQREIKEHFKPRPKFLKEVTPKYKQNGEMSRSGVMHYVDDINDIGGSFSVFEYRDFNLASPKQIIERLDECGWKPRVFTPKGSPKVCEENLETIPDTAPEPAKKLAEGKMLETRWKTVEAWLDNLDENSRVHGDVHTMGAVTGRMTHSNPNMANVVSNDKPYGEECRSCWSSPNEQYRIVGMDAKGLELRMLAHYMRDKDYMDVVVNGDPHTVNMKAAGLTTRAQSKTFIYAFLYGAGAEKLGKVVGGNATDGARLKRDFLNNMPSLARLISKVQRLSEVGSIEGLDGRLILVRHQHASLNTLLQGAGAITCKQWSICMDDYIKQEGLRAYLVNTIHDEMQFEVHVKDVDKIISASDLTMQKAGRILGVRLPLNADAKVGLNWAETH